jgi:hypothetical protein
MITRFQLRPAESRGVSVGILGMRMVEWPEACVSRWTKMGFNLNSWRVVEFSRNKNYCYWANEYDRVGVSINREIRGLLKSFTVRHHFFTYRGGCLWPRGCNNHVVTFHSDTA